MSKKLLSPALALALAALGFAGCTEDDMPGTRRLPAGTEFNFGAGVESSQTRTYYDPTDVANANATAWGICWNRQGDGALDQIYIYSPQALTGRNQATYTVTPEKETGDNYSAPATKAGEAGVQTSDATSYDFYAMYPASAVTGTATGTTISGTLPSTQTATTTETMGNDAITTLQAKADMNCALMIAKNTGYTPTADNAVDLQFQPFATMLDITVNGLAAGSNADANVRITSVIIEANAPIAGDFTYDYSTGTLTPAATASNTITIDTKFADADGNRLGVKMGEGSKLRVRAFLLPNTAVGAITVKVVTSEAKTLKRSLIMDNFKPSQIHFVSLPKIPVDKLTLDYSIWLAQLDPSIYLSEISMPGSALSFNYLATQDYQKTQTLDIAAQFNQGVRVFQCYVNTVNQTSVIDGGSTSVGVSIPIGNSKAVNAMKEDNTYWTLGDILKTLQAEMQGTHSEEFCVLSIADWIQDVTLDEMRALYERLGVVLEKAGEQGLVPTSVTPETTIADVKGKIIIKLQLSGRTDIGQVSSLWTYMSGSNAWMNVFKSNTTDGWTATAPVFSPMPYGTLPDTEAGGFAAKDLTGEMNLIYAEEANPVYYNDEGQLYWQNYAEDNATDVIAAYNTNYSSDEHKNFALTYLGGCGAMYKTRIWVSDGWFTGHYEYSYTYTYPSEVAQTLNNKWSTYTKPTDKPWGWVMFNCVGTEQSTSDCISKVIEHNADPNFTLRRRQSGGSKAAPSGDTKGTANGGAAF